MTEEYDLPRNDKFEALRDLAVVRAKQNEEKVKALTRTLILCGSKQVGKTSMLNHLLDRNVPARPTLALEYSFGRKLNRDGVKDTCNFWELGGGTTFSAVIPQLIKTPLKERRVVSVAFILDLTKPAQLWLTFDKLMKAVKSSLKQYAEEKPDHYSLLYSKCSNQFFTDHPDHPDVACIEIPIIRLHIVGAKYDEFQNFDPEKKKVICRTLRTAALIYGSSLHFTSTTENALIKRGKEVLHYAGFEFNPPSSINVDHNGPLSIPPGFDTLKDIGSVSSRSSSAIKTELEQYFTSHFPQVEEENLELEDPSAHASFKEPHLDFILKRKRGEVV
ncbi:cytoplasmic dynein 2 light intermediate chain 1 [Frankliniella occidentalis]|uniref:Cytoplasmic dynein 2 light intermediate chain 1 n=1 Tax=Frankliniella occidentalis TaxID=133901 RepID=A0A6J1SB19_FRAOC|nr:cytoplasmic dynein 2 light intermediate chain 1 [Frankliniella occidentalis]